MVKFVGNYLLKNKWAIATLLARTPHRLSLFISQNNLLDEAEELVISRASEALRLERLTFELPEKVTLKREEEGSGWYDLYSYVQKSKGSHQLWNQLPHAAYTPILRGRIHRDGVVIRAIVDRRQTDHTPILDYLQVAKEAVLRHEEQIEDFNYVLPHHIERALFRYKHSRSK